MDNRRLTRKYAKKDLNHAEIVAFFRSLGCSVVDVASIPKFCDVIVGIKGVNVFVEIKSGKNGLTPDEKLFHDKWTGAEIFIVRNEKEAQELYDRICMDR